LPCRPRNIFGKGIAAKKEKEALRRLFRKPKNRIFREKVAEQEFSEGLGMTT